MPPKPSLDLTKKTLNLRTGDFEKMGELFPELGSSKAIRQFLSKIVDKYHTPHQGSVDDDQGEFNL